MPAASETRPALEPRLAERPLGAELLAPVMQGRMAVTILNLKASRRRKSGSVDRRAYPARVATRTPASGGTNICHAKLDSSASP